MAQNQLVCGMPSTVEVGGISVQIETSYRIWIQIWQLKDNPTIETSKKTFGVLYLAYPQESLSAVLANQVEALEAAMSFLDRSLGDTTPSRPKTAREKRLSRLRLFDWDFDATRVISDFLREYRLDLTDSDQDMHWWRFMALFNGLSDTSSTMEAISIRAADLNAEGVSGEQKKALRERKASVLLPARTEEEAARNRQILRGC